MSRWQCRAVGTLAVWSNRVLFLYHFLVSQERFGGYSLFGLCPHSFYPFFNIRQGNTWHVSMLQKI